MNEEYLKSAREVIGDFLKQMREGKGISRYNVAKQAGWERIDPVVRIENGETYNIDTLLRYLKATDIYIFFSEKNKSNPDATAILFFCDFLLYLSINAPCYLSTE